MIKLKDILEASTMGGYAADPGEPDTGFIRGGKKRTLGKLEGKPEPWFESGGYTQMHYPEADHIMGKNVAPEFSVIKTIIEDGMIKLKDLLEVDFHSKLSRGHKPDWYQLGTSEFKPYDENTAPDHDGKAAPFGSGYDEVGENFADGKKPGRKGISKRVGIPKGATIAQLEKLAKAKGEKGRMARWQLNMRRGKKKK
jgi:hypothetical protein